MMEHPTSPHFFKLNKNFQKLFMGGSPRRFICSCHKPPFGLHQNLSYTQKNQCFIKPL